MESHGKYLYVLWWVTVQTKVFELPSTDIHLSLLSDPGEKYSSKGIECWTRELEVLSPTDPRSWCQTAAWGSPWKLVKNAESSGPALGIKIFWPKNVDFLFPSFLNHWSNLFSYLTWVPCLRPHNSLVAELGPFRPCPPPSFLPLGL